MSRAFRRAWSVTIGTTRIESGTNELALKFSVEKSLEREPNKATVQIANLRPDRRRQLEQLSSPQIELRAGYIDMEDVIFVGDARDIWSERDKTDVVTNIEAEDGGRSYRTATLERSFTPNVSVVTVLRACTDAMGVGIGNAASIISSAELDTAGDRFAGGVVLSGQAWRSLDRICRSCSLSWSIQNGVLQLRQAGLPAETRAIRLAPSTGLIGSPTRGMRDERTNRVAYQARCLIMPGLYPGRVITLESSEINGGFLCRRVGFSGDSSGEDWFAELELEEY